METYFEEKLAENAEKQAKIDQFIADHGGVEGLPDVIVDLLLIGRAALTKKDAALSMAMTKRDEARAIRAEQAGNNGQGGNPNA